MEADWETSSVAPRPTSSTMSKPLPHCEQICAFVGLGVWQCEQIIYWAPMAARSVRIMIDYSSQNARTGKGSAPYRAELTAATLPSGNLREISEGDFVVTHALVEIGEQRSRFRGNHRGFAIGSGEGVDGSEGLPVRGDDNFDCARERTRANRYAQEAVEALQLRPHCLLEMVQVGVGQRRRGLRRPETGDHVRRTPRTSCAARCPRPLSSFALSIC